MMKIMVCMIIIMTRMIGALVARAVWYSGTHGGTQDASNYIGICGLSKGYPDLSRASLILVEDQAGSRCAISKRNWRTSIMRRLRQSPSSRWSWTAVSGKVKTHIWNCTPTSVDPDNLLTNVALVRLTVGNLL